MTAIGGFKSRTAAEAKRNPCSACPWRLANQGRRHPGGWYTKANLRRLWAGMRRGHQMSCHPTDPTNLVPAGWPQVPPDITTRECAGVLVLIQRELQLCDQLAKQPDGTAEGIRRYRALRPRGLTREGLLVNFGRAMLGGTPLGGMPMTAQDIDRRDVGYPDAVPWPADVPDA